MLSIATSNRGRASSRRTSERQVAEAHNIAFLQCDYERRFSEQVAADAAAPAKLEQLARRAEREDVYLVCYEGRTKACHRRILLRIAAKDFGAQVAVDGLEPR